MGKFQSVHAWSTPPRPNLVAPGRRGARKRKMGADAPENRNMTPGALRTRKYRDRLARCTRVARVEVDIWIVNALVASGFLRNGDASEGALQEACQRALEAWARETT